MTDDRVKEAHERIRGVLRITTNVMTAEGRKVVVAWNHYPQGLTPADTEPTQCHVEGYSLDEALRKVISLEDELIEADKPDDHGSGHG